MSNSSSMFLISSDNLFQYFGATTLKVRSPIETSFDPFSCSISFLSDRPHMIITGSAYGIYLFFKRQVLTMITPSFLTCVLCFMSIQTTFNESIMTLEHCLPVPAIKNSVFFPLSLSQLLYIQLLISDVHKWSCSAV